jgi:hypothetical protein
VHAVRPGRSRDIGTVVDHDGGAAFTSPDSQATRHFTKRPGLDLTLADLNQIHSTDCIIEPALEGVDLRPRRPGVGTEPAPIGDET